MRYDTPIYFRSTQKGAFNAETHNYEPDSFTEVKTYASVTDAKNEALTLIYGKLKQDAKVVRLLRPYPFPFEFVRIDKKLYSVDFSRSKKVFYLSEVQANAGNKI